MMRSHDFFATLSFILGARTTWACGGFFCEPQQPIIQAGEAIAFGVQGNTVTMQVQIVYEGPADAFSWVLPMPYVPEVSVGSDVMFDALFRQTLPTFVLNVDTENSDACDQSAFTDDCAVAESAGDMADDSTRGAIIVEKGTVGPFDYTILEPDENDPTTVFTWLQENGYDQPDDAAPLINYYAIHDQKFVALKLTSNADSGDIQPVILKYDMPTVDTQTAFACVPIKLTSIAATDDMPIYLYMLGDARAIPLNYLDMQLDDTQVDWLTCVGNPGCYYNDYLARFRNAVNEVENRTFVTEYAGDSSIMANAIAIPLSVDDLKDLAPVDFLNALADAGVPAIPFVTGIIDEYIPNPRVDPFCAEIYNPSSVSAMDSCVETYANPDDFDAEGLATELDEKVFQPAEEAQAWVDSHAYLTRMYGQLSPQNMDKDPFFAFNSALPDVSNIHTASAIPYCTESSMQVTELAITVDGISPYLVPGGISCGFWFRSASSNNFSPALQVAQWNFEGQESILVERLTSGDFDLDEIRLAIDAGDALVMNQTVPEYTLPVTSGSTSSYLHLHGVLASFGMACLTSIFF